MTTANTTSDHVLLEVGEHNLTLHARAGCKLRLLAVGGGGYGAQGTGGGSGYIMVWSSYSNFGFCSALGRVTEIYPRPQPCLPCK